MSKVGCQELTYCKHFVMINRAKSCCPTEMIETLMGKFPAVFESKYVLRRWGLVIIFDIPNTGNDSFGIQDHLSIEISYFQGKFVGDKVINPPFNNCFFLGTVHKLRHPFWDLLRPPPPPLSSNVIFWLPPPHVG